MDLWRNFTVKSRDLLVKAFRAKSAGSAQLERIVQWAGLDGGDVNLVEDEARRAETFPRNLFAFQVWDTTATSTAPGLMRGGWDVILSNWDSPYLDCGASGWVKPGGTWCPYVDWYRIYDALPSALALWNVTDTSHLLGSEVCIWTEKFEDADVEQAIWPRAAAAAAERLWSNPGSDWRAADARFQRHRNRMTRRGIAPAALQPSWCAQYGPDLCSLYS